MRIRVLHSIIFIFLLISCSEKNNKQEISSDSIVSTDLTFKLIYSDSIGYGSRGMEFYNNSLFLSGIKGYLFKLSHEFKVKTLANFNDSTIDFRDLLILNDNELLVCNSGPDLGLIFKITAKGVDTVYSNTSTGVFLDDLDKDAYGNIYCLGDPMNEELFLLKSTDKGANWERILKNVKIKNGEFFFAASGSCMSIENDFIYLAIGGASSYVLKINLKTEEFEKIPSAIPSGESSGINSILVENNSIYTVGGDYAKKGEGQNTFESISNSKTINSSTKGYKSSIAKNEKILVCTGINGTEYSTDKGISWHKLTDQGFYKVILTNSHLYCSGGNGKIAIYQIEYGKH